MVIKGAPMLGVVAGNLKTCSGPGKGREDRVLVLNLASSAAHGRGIDARQKFTIPGEALKKANHAPLLCGEAGPKSKSRRALGGRPQVEPRKQTNQKTCLLLPPVGRSRGATLKGLRVG